MLLVSFLILRLVLMAFGSQLIRHLGLVQLGSLLVLMSRIDALWLNFNLMLLLVHSSDSFDFRLQLRIAPVQPTLLVRLGCNIA